MLEYARPIAHPTYSTTKFHVNTMRHPFETHLQVRSNNMSRGIDLSHHHYNLLPQTHHWPGGLPPLKVSNAIHMALDCIRRPDIDRSTLPYPLAPAQISLKLPDFSAFRIASSNPGRVCPKVRLPDEHTWPGVGHPKILMAFKSLGNRPHSTMLHIM